MGKPNPVMVTIAAAIWYLGGIALVLLLSNVSDDLYPIRYLIIGIGSIVMVLPAIWIRVPAGTLLRMRREEIVVRYFRIALFGAGVLSLVAIGLTGVAQRSASLTIFALVLLSYFVLGVTAFGSMLAHARLGFYSSRCPRCLYDLTAVESSTCPECGLAITPPGTAAS